jgi:hypothetical protein
VRRPDDWRRHFPHSTGIDTQQPPGRMELGYAGEGGANTRAVNTWTGLSGLRKLSLGPFLAALLARSGHRQASGVFQLDRANWTRAFSKERPGRRTANRFSRRQASNAYGPLA